MNIFWSIYITIGIIVTSIVVSAVANNKPLNADHLSSVGPIYRFFAYAILSIVVFVSWPIWAGFIIKKALKF